MQGAALPDAVRALSAVATSAPRPPAAVPLLLVHASAWQAGAPGACGAPEGTPPRTSPACALAGACPDACAFPTVARRLEQPCGSGATWLPGVPAKSNSIWGSASPAAGPAAPALSAHPFRVSRQAATTGACGVQARERCLQDSELPGTQASWAMGLSPNALGCLRVQAASEGLSRAPPERQALSQGMVQGLNQALGHDSTPRGCAVVYTSQTEALGALKQSALQSPWGHAPQLPASNQGLGALALQEPVAQLYPYKGFLHSTAERAQHAPEGLPCPSQGVPCQLPGDRAQLLLTQLRCFGQGLEYPIPDALLQQAPTDIDHPIQGFGKGTGLLHEGFLQRLLAQDGQALQGQQCWLATGAHVAANDAVHQAHAQGLVANPVLLDQGSAMPWAAGAPDLGWGSDVLPQAVAGSGLGFAGWVAQHQ